MVKALDEGQDILYRAASLSAHERSGVASRRDNNRSLMRVLLESSMESVMAYQWIAWASIGKSARDLSMWVCKREEMVGVT